VTALEHPEFQTVHIDADPAEEIAHDAADLVGELLATDAHDEIALRSGLRFVARVTPAPLSAVERHGSRQRAVRYGRDGFALRAPESGNLDDLRPFVTQRREPGPGQVELRVQAAGMNFRDVLICLGVLPSGSIGFECAGEVTAVGPDVTTPSVGDQVLAVDLTGGGAFGSFLTTEAALTMPVPADVDPATAAGIPTVFVTAWYALKEVAKLRAGEQVLIHSGTGGTGLAAISVARALGATVLATAGNPSKRSYLHGMGIRQVMDSRSLDFVEQTRSATDGQGVDVVLNSLAGPAVRAGMESLRPFGRFVELGLRDILADSPLGMLPFSKNITFASVNLIELYRNRPERIAEILRELTEAFATGQLTPVPAQTFPLEAATEAFRFMAGGTHVGKLVLTVPDDATTSAYLPNGAPAPVRADGSYLITGGLGGVGLETAAWLASHGAGRVVLNGRSAPTPHSTQRLAEMAESGTDIQVVLGDITEDGVAERLVTTCSKDGFELAGIVHAAMVLNDAAVTNTTTELFDRVWRPKVLGAWRLHEATAHLKLDWFTIYSSMSSMLGNPGQSAYAAANSWLDNFTDWRSVQGLPTTTINWGPWGQVGAATDFESRGYSTIGVREGLHALETLLIHRRRRTGVLPGDPATWIPAAGRSSSLFSALITDTGEDHEVGSDAADIRSQLQAAAPGLARRAAFEAYLTEHLSVVLRLDNTGLDPDTPLRSLGFDSLLALELRSRLEPGLGIKLPGNFIWKYSTLATLAAGLADYAALPLDE
jgi:NADPH:quinone reductase-like Zn-dependent oxidoreductase/acyl carrier protein